MAPVPTLDRLQVSERVMQTDEPVIVKTKKLMAAATNVVSLAQGLKAGTIFELSKHRQVHIATLVFFILPVNLSA